MIGQRSLSITSRKDLEIGTLEQSFVNFLSVRSNVYGHESRRFISEFKKALFEMQDLNVPKELEPDQVRRNHYMNIFFATLETVTKRDLARILNSYACLNLLDAIMQAKSSRA